MAHRLQVVRRVAVLVLGALVATTCATESDDRPDELAAPRLVYVHDSLGRLRAVADPDGDIAVYDYDATGNLLGVDSRPSDALSVVEVVPRTATAGDAVVVSGSGFAGDPDDNTVRFGDAEAEVTAATPFRLTVEAPAGGVNGPVEVEASGRSAASSFDVVVDDDRTPVIEGFTPAIAAPGDEVRVKGANFTGDPLLDQVVVGGSTYATVTSASKTELLVTVPPTAPTGRLTVATPFGSTRSEAPLVVAPLGYVASDVGTRQRLALDRQESVEVAAGQVTLVSFVGERGQAIDLDFGDDGWTCIDLSLGLADPSGVALVDPQAEPFAVGSDDAAPWCAIDGTETDRGVMLPTGGRYTLTLAGRSEDDDGRVDLRLRDVDAPSAPSPAPVDDEAAEDREVPFEGGDVDDVTGVREPAALVAGAGDVLDGIAWLPVDLASGTLVHEETDLVAADDLLPVSLTRNHWAVPSGPGFGPTGQAAEFGLGAALEFDMEVKPSSALQFVELVLPNGVSVVFDRTQAGTDRESATFLHSTTPTGFFGSTIAWSGTSWDMRLPEGAVLEFGPNGWLRAVRDRNGNATTIQRAEETDQFGLRTDGKVTSVHSPTGRWLGFSYDAEGRVSEARNHVGDVVSYRYDGTGRLAGVATAAADGTSSETVYSYDERGLLSTIGRDGQQLTIEYDAAGRVVRQTLADGSQYAFAYTTEVQPTEIEGVTVDRVVRAEVTEPTGSLRRVDFVTGRWVADAYAAGTPLEQVITVERDPTTGYITAQVDPDGVRTGYSYDADGNVVAVTGAEGADDETLTTFDYASGPFDLTAVVGTASRRDLSYDRRGNVREDTASSGVSTGFRYDRHGRVTAVTDPAGARTTVRYELGHRVTVTDPQGGALTEFYDAAGRLAARTGPSGVTTTFAYDGFDRLRRVVDPASGATELEYDQAGNVVSVTDAGNHRTAYTYDAVGRVTSRTDPAGASEQLAYDAAGNVVARTDRRGVQSRFEYDALGRLSLAAYGVAASGATESAESTIRYSYDAAGRLVLVEDSAYGSISLAYDDLDRLVGETTPQGEVGYEYDAAGRRTSMSLGSATAGLVFAYEYDRRGLLSSIRHGEVAVEFERDSAGRVERVSLPNDVTADYSYDERGVVSGLGWAVGDRVLGDYWYRYDSAAQRSAVGGDLARTAMPETRDGLTYGPGNRLESDGEGDGGSDGEGDGAAFEYDAAGNLTSDGSNTYTWDARGQLVAVSGALDAAFAYDPFGRRTSKTIDGVTTTYTYDGQNVLRTQTGEVTTTYVHGLGLDELYARVVGDEVTTYLTDGQGSVTGLVGADGSLSTRYRYDPFGRTVVDGEDDPNPFTYTGRELDETGLHYLRARYYSASQGRFVSEDPIGFAGGDPNLYAYALNDPVTFSDPSGLQAATIAGLLICAAAGGWYFSVLSRVIDEWEQLGVFGPEPVSAGSVEVQISIDQGFQEILIAGQIALTICSVALGLPGLGGAIGRGATSFGRAASNLASRGGARFATRFPNAAARISARFPNASTRLGLNAAGRLPPQTGARFVANSEGVVTNLVPRPPNAISIGRFPAYVDDAAATGARAFNVGDEWAAMAARTDRFGGTGAGSEIWVRNTRFLDDAAARNSSIRLASDPLDPLNEGSFFLREIDYLRAIGVL